MNKSQVSGYSLIELMITFSVIFIIVGLILPGLYSGKIQAERIECANNLRQAAQILNSWAKDHQKMPDNFNQLVEEGYVDDLDLFKCSVTGKKNDWQYKVAGEQINNLRPNNKLIHCKHCNLTVYYDAHVEFSKLE